MPRVRLTRARTRKPTVLTAQERRRFRRLERTLRATDPAWLARHHPRRHRYGRLARHAAAVLALALVLAGALTGVMLVVFCGVLVASGTLTSHVSSRAGRGH